MYWDEKQFDHGDEPRSKLRVFYSPLCGIVQLTNSDALRFRNWSFTNKSFELKKSSFDLFIKIAIKNSQKYLAH
jgi:hypothetical protein